MRLDKLFISDSKVDELDDMISDMVKVFPRFMANIEGTIGSLATNFVYNRYLRGQEMTFHTSGLSGSGKPLSVEGRKAFGKKTRGGRKMIGYHIGKGCRSVSIGSKAIRYNEPRFHIFEKATSAISSVLNTYAEEGLQKAVQSIDEYKDWKV